MALLTPAALALRDSILARPEIILLRDLFLQHRFELRLVGGAVRDILMGVSPKDYDFATPATPELITEILESAGIRVVPTGLQHGTVTAVIGHVPFEITTLRVDTDHTGRHAAVAFTESWEEDCSRRDLTINAMALDLSNGTIYDYHGGLADLARREVRFVGDAAQRIQEDYLRILRYFRIHGKVDAAEAKDRHDETTLKAIHENAAGLDAISKERIHDEMVRILPLPTAPQELRRMLSVDVLAHVGLAHVEERHIQTLERVLRSCTEPMCLLAALVDSEQDFEAMVGEWRLSKAERRLGTFVCSQRHFDVQQHHVEDMLVDGHPWEHVEALLLYQAKEELAKTMREWPVPRFPVTGKDIKGLGLSIPAGPLFGLFKAALVEQWKASRFQLQRDELLALAPQVFCSLN